jgi:hypothetical protein
VLDPGTQIAIIPTNPKREEKRMSSARLLVLLVPAATLLLGGCSRWMEYAPIRLQGQVKGSRVVYHRLVQRSRALGYQVEWMNPRQGYYRVRAQLDQRRRWRPRKMSYFHVWVRPGGVVDVSVQGFHIRDRGSLIHRKLCAELTHYLDSLVPVLGPPGRAPVAVSLYR